MVDDQGRPLEFLILGMDAAQVSMLEGPGAAAFARFGQALRRQREAAA